MQGHGNLKITKKYENYSEQEIINMIIDVYVSTIKYKYNGIPLKEYCLNKGIGFNGIMARIYKLKNKNKELSNEQLVTLALEKSNNKNFSYLSEGIALKKYCNANPELNYNSLRTYISREKLKNPKLTIDDLIEIYLNKEHKGIYKHYYLGYL